MKKAIFCFCAMYLCFCIVEAFAQQQQNSSDYFVVTFSGDTIHINIDTQNIKHISGLIPIGPQDSIYLDITEEDRLFIKKEVMRHHVQYMEYFHSDNRSTRRRQQQLCRLLQNKFVDYREIFQFDQNYTKNSLLDSTLINMPEVFHIRPYNSVLYSSIKYYPPKIPDTLQNYKISFGTSLRNAWDWDYIFGGNTYSGEDGYVYVEGNKFPYMPKYIHLSFNDTQLYINFTHVFRSFNLTTTNNATCTLMKVQYVIKNNFYTSYICYSKNAQFTSNNIFNFDNNLQLNSYLNNNFSPVEQPFQYQFLRHNYIKFPEKKFIDYKSLFQSYEKGELEKFTGLIDLANLIAGDFIPTWANGNVIEYKDGYYTVEVKGLLNPYCEEMEKCCKTPFPSTNLYTSYMYFSAFRHILDRIPIIRQLVFRKNKLCSNLEKEIPWCLHIRINPETGNIQLKIVEMLDISKMPWCPN